MNKKLGYKIKEAINKALKKGKAPIIPIDNGYCYMKSGDKYILWEVKS